MSHSNDQKESNKNASKLIQGRFPTQMRRQLRPIILSILYFKQNVPLQQEVLIIVVLLLFLHGLQYKDTYTSRIQYQPNNSPFVG